MAFLVGLLKQVWLGGRRRLDGCGLDYDRQLASG